MKKLTIEWRHFDIAGETCDRCYDTGETLTAEIKRLNRALNPRDITVELVETLLDKANVSQSNLILFDGVPLEQLIDISVSQNFCASCTALVGSETYCRTIEFDGNEYEDIPAKAIRKAAYQALGLQDNKQNKSACCSGGCGCSSDE